MSNSKSENFLSSTLPIDAIPTLTYRSFSSSDLNYEDKKSLKHILIGNNINEKDIEFLVERQIGLGGLGEVNLANQLCFDRNVAIKQVRQDKKNLITSKHLRQESSLMGQLEHPAIPPVHTVGLDSNDEIVLIMKYIQGSTWLEILERDYKKINSKELLPSWYLEKHLGFFLRIGEALEYAHKKQIIHRDIKPENVVIGDYGEVYLIDWGIAVTLNKSSFYGRSYAGTPCYAAPEMIKEFLWDIKSDIYLMGGTLFHIITGSPPHLGKDSKSVFEKIVRDPSPIINNKVSSGLCAICKSAMMKDSSDRYSSVHAMLEDIRHFMIKGEINDLYVQAQEDLNKIKKISNGQSFSDDIEIIGSRCRYRLEEINIRWPEHIGVKYHLQECLTILIDHAIDNKRLAVSRALLKQYKELIEKDNLVAHNKDWLEECEKKIRYLSNQLISRSDELGTGIQVLLVEELAAQKKAYKELKEAYVKLKRGD